MQNRTKPSCLSRNVFFVVLVLLPMIVGGCGTARKEVHISYLARGGGPVSTIKSHTVAITVEDRRPEVERECVSKVDWKTGGGQAIDYFSKETVPSVIKNAVKAELERSGHRVLFESGLDADIRVRMVVERFIAFTSGGGKSAEISAEISTSSKGVTKASAPFQVSGNYQWKPNKLLSAWKPDPTEPLDNALAEFVHNLMFDPRFVEAMGP